jgi:drug/metabolite transporter (DMT)-like permease
LANLILFLAVASNLLAAEGVALLHNGIVVAIIAHGLVGVTLLVDKILLRTQEAKNVLSYVFWIGAMSGAGVILAPFGFRMPPLSVAALAWAAGALQLAAIYFYYTALDRGEASETLAIMGGFSPIATALIAIPLLGQPVVREQLLGFILTTLGGFAMFLTEKLNLRRTLPAILASAATFGLVNVLQKLVFNRTNFVTGYVFFTAGTFTAAMALLLIPACRKQILRSAARSQPRYRALYFANRVANGLGSFLIFYAVSRADPAAVDAIGTERYVVIFLGAYALTRLKPVWLKENFRGWVLAGKIAATALVAAGLVMMAQSSMERQ